MCVLLHSTKVDMLELSIRFFSEVFMEDSVLLCEACSAMSRSVGSQEEDKASKRRARPACEISCLCEQIVRLSSDAKNMLTVLLYCLVSLVER